MRTELPLPAALWEALPVEAQALILALRAEVGTLRDKVHELEQQVQELQSQLNRNSTNSSRPPSTDPPTCSLTPDPDAHDLRNCHDHGKERHGSQHATEHSVEARVVNFSGHRICAHDDLPKHSNLCTAPRKARFW
jgi:hypothetical protein